MNTPTPFDAAPTVAALREQAADLDARIASAEARSDGAAARATTAAQALHDLRTAAVLGEAEPGAETAAADEHVAARAAAQDEQDRLEALCSAREIVRQRIEAARASVQGEQLSQVAADARALVDEVAALRPALDAFRERRVEIVNRFNAARGDAHGHTATRAAHTLTDRGLNAFLADIEAACDEVSLAGDR